MKGSCRENILPRSEESSHVRRWFRGNTKIGPVLDVKVCHHQGHYGVEIMIESLCRDIICSWVRVVNGINKYVTETSREIPDASVENRGTGKFVAKAKPRPTPTLTLSLVSIRYRERTWIDIEECKMMYSYRMTSPITFTTLGTLTTWEEEVSKGTGSPCFSQP